MNNSTFYLICYKEKRFIYHISELEIPPPIDKHALEEWLKKKHQRMLPTGDAPLLVEMKPDDYVPVITQPGIHVLQTHKGETEPPEWLCHYQHETEQQIDRWLLIGEPTLYGHVLPIKDEYDYHFNQRSNDYEPATHFLPQSR